MTLKKLGKPPYLRAEEVKDGDVVEIVEEPYIVPAEQTKWGRSRGQAIVKLTNRELRTWPMNTTTWDCLFNAFGSVASKWIGKRVVINRVTQNISGKNRLVLFGEPYSDPQQTLNADNPLNQSEDTQRLLKDLNKLSPEQRKAVFEGFKQ